MKYIIVLLALFLSSCASPRYIVNTDKCEAIGGTWFNCKDKNSVQEY